MDFEYKVLFKVKRNQRRINVICILKEEYEMNLESLSVSVHKFYILQD